MADDGADATATAGAGEAGARADALWPESTAGTIAAATASEVNRFRMGLLMDFL
jgi:hypothetical protein